MNTPKEVILETLNGVNKVAKDMGINPDSMKFYETRKQILLLLLQARRHMQAT